jgi:hypothetical protein
MGTRITQTNLSTVNDTTIQTDTNTPARQSDDRISGRLNSRSPKADRSPRVFVRYKLEKHRAHWLFHALCLVTVNSQLACLRVV